MATSKKETTQAVKVFTKEQLVKSKKYMCHVDFLNGNLQDGKTYTIEQVDKLISKHYGKGKSE
jgi:hypothetical protein